MAEAIGFEEIVRRSRAERGLNTEVPQEPDYRGKEALGFEQMIQRDRDARRPKPETHAIEASTTVAPNIISGYIEKAVTIFSPPQRAEFEDFYQEINYTNNVSATVENGNTFAITNFSQKTLRIPVRTFLEILAQQMHTSVRLPTDITTKVAPPFISNIKEITNFYISEMLCAYQKIFNFNDPRIERLCQEYYESMSYPLLVRLAYSEWENRQMGWKVSQAVEEIKNQKEKEVHNIRTDYANQLEMKTIAKQTELNQAHRENDGLKTSLNVMNERLENAKQDLENNAGTVTELHQKMKSEEAKAQKAEAELRKAVSELEELKKKLKIVEETDWRKDFTHSPENPVFINVLDDTVIAFPCSMDDFKKNYKPGKKEGDSRNYKFGDKNFAVPISLANKIPKLIMEQAPTAQKGTSEKQEKGKDKEIPPTVQKIMEFLSKNSEKTIEDISIAIDVAVNHLYEHLKTLTENGTIIKKHSEDRGGNVYSMAAI